MRWLALNLNPSSLARFSPTVRRSAFPLSSFCTARALAGVTPGPPRGCGRGGGESAPRAGDFSGKDHRALRLRIDGVAVMASGENQRTNKRRQGTPEDFPRNRLPAPAVRCQHGDRSWAFSFSLLLLSFSSRLAEGPRKAESRSSRAARGCFPPRVRAKGDPPAAPMGYIQFWARGLAVSVASLHCLKEAICRGWPGSRRNFFVARGRAPLWPRPPARWSGIWARPPTAMGFRGPRRILGKWVLGSAEAGRCCGLLPLHDEPDFFPIGSVDSCPHKN